MSSVLESRSDFEDESPDQEENKSPLKLQSTSELSDDETHEMATQHAKADEAAGDPDEMPMSDKELQTLTEAIEEDERQARENAIDDADENEDEDDLTEVSEDEYRNRIFRIHEANGEETIRDMVSELRDGVVTNIQDLLATTSDEQLEEWARDPNNDFMNLPDEEAVDPAINGFHGQWTVDQDQDDQNQDQNDF